MVLRFGVQLILVLQDCLVLFLVHVSYLCKRWARRSTIFAREMSNEQTWTPRIEGCPG